MKKMVVGLAYWLDHLADQIWLATVFFQVFITPNYPKCEKNQLPVLPTIRQARPSTRLNFYQWPFFLRFGLFGVDLEKKIQPKKPLNCYLTIDDVIMHG